MPDMVIARNIFLVVIACCVFLALGAFFGKRLSLQKLSKYTGITALVVLIGGVIYIAVILFSNPDAVETVKSALIVIGVLIGCCLFLTLGGLAAKRFEVYRVVIACGMLIVLAIIVFLIYLAYLSFLA